MPSTFQNKFDPAVWEAVSQIPPGHVKSYGEIARVAGYPRHARMVSKAMSRSPKPLPWFRVIRSDHTLAFKIGSTAYNRQKELLEHEGVEFINGKAKSLNNDKNISLDKLLWGIPPE